MYEEEEGEKEQDQDQYISNQICTTVIDHVVHGMTMRTTTCQHRDLSVATITR